MPQMSCINHIKYNRLLPEYIHIHKFLSIVKHYVSESFSVNLFFSPAISKIK